MIPQDGITLPYLMAALRRRFWYVVLPFFLVLLGAVVYCIKAPRVYRSTTTILVQPQEVPKDYIKPTVTADINARLQTITEQVMSRSRLETIIRENDLYRDIRRKETMYDAVDAMRRNISVELADGSKKQSQTVLTSFQISFQGPDPAKVRDVTAALARYFIDDNLKLREEQAVGTSRFLSRELQRMEGVLRQKEEQVRQFKEKYMGLLPEQMENNHRILSQLQQHLDSINGALQKTEDRKVLLQTQLRRIETLQKESSQPAGSLSPADKPSSLEDLRRQLQSLRSRYTEQHPDVVKLKAMIAEMEKEQQNKTDAAASEASDAAAPSLSEAQQLASMQKDDLLIELNLINKELRALRQDQEKTTREIEEYRRRIEVGPKIEQMFVDLRRGYEEAKSSYQSLLQKKMQAELAENMERTQKGEQLMVLDPANLPRKPFKPNIQRILAMGLVLALGCGFGLAFLREYLDQTFWNSKELESYLKLPVLVSIPVIVTPRDRRWSLFKKFGAATATAGMATVLAYALYILWRQNPNIIPL
ncbi:MAG: hypothetical protein JRJ12_16690 [Deltaproteobacteria bacterium]|nr:hypothetical protein [Deltaproteobacteria bacterium]